LEEEKDPEGIVIMKEATEENVDESQKQKGRSEYITPEFIAQMEEEE
jgi:hypothetical protein